MEAVDPVPKEKLAMNLRTAFTAFYIQFRGVQRAPEPIPRQSDWIVGPMLKYHPPHPQPINKAIGYMGEGAHHPPKPLLSWDLGFALAGSGGLPSLLRCGVGTGVAGGRGRAGKAITGLPDARIVLHRRTMLLLTPSGYPFRVEIWNCLD